ncbi:hypothetical protein [Streptomyces scabiei]|uniref:hypothetical protein n=1 Tax=Streptomyces scabiei TaxID=1930 RepID=UPI001B339662|nr:MULTISPECIES: hypothetical protein [Streptomyces]MBP5920746.1 hypothetical protein [Streptomyces sp. LBUM 1483]MDX2538849.1 hypothetical protein [Streptomyces scabiei]MDX2802332.1 hypothetical protein [Streptomyces scabiei]MDX3295001.1 hypothetical protein [Streptomyces scabiei]MDX3829007.1 hypothetical protein [Streptomyces scabiei]
MTTSSHPHPFGFHASSPTLAAPMPLRQVPALQAAVNPDLPATPLVVQGPEPVLPMCASCGNRRGPLAPHGQQRYRSGAQVLVCKGGCHITPVQAATGVITAAMANGGGTPGEIAQAEEDAGLLFDPQRAKDIAAAAVEAARAEMSADLQQARQALEQAREDRHTRDWFHSRYLAVGRLCAGRQPDYCLTVSEVLTAIDGKADDAPLGITWDGVLAPPAGDRPGEPTLVGCTTARGGSAVLALDDDQRVDLAVKLLAVVPPATFCSNRCCGTATADLVESDPTLWGGIVLDVVGTDSGQCWWCSPACAIAAMTKAGTELQAADHAAAIAPSRQALPAPMVVEDDVAHCSRCGCTEDRACEGGCYWVPNPQHIDLCSGCASPQELAFAALRPQGGQEATQ